MTGIRFIPSSTGAGSRVGIGLSSIVGATGAMGYQGYQGPAGVASMTGATGLQGFQGLVGATGAGFQGLQGYVGPTGPSNPGVQGYQGFQGLVGATGPSNPGVQGLQGLVGSSGAIGQIGPQGSAGMGFVIFATTNSYTGLNTIIATGGNVGEFVLITGGDLFVYSGTGAGSTGPGDSYQYAGDITDESKLVGMQGAQGLMGLQGIQGLMGLQGAIYTGPFVDISFSGNMSGANAYLQNLAAQNAAFQGTNIGFNGLLVVGPTTLIGALQATGGLNAPNATIKDLVVTGSIVLPTGASAGPQGSQGLIGPQGSQYTGPFTTLTVSGLTTLNNVQISGFMTGTSASLSYLKVTDLVVGGETGGSLYINTGVVSNLTVMNQIITGNLTLATGATIGSVGDTLFTDASLNVANVFTVNAYNGDVTSTGTLKGSTGVFEHLTITGDLTLATGTIINGDINLATGSVISSSSDTLFTDASLNVANVFVVNAYNGDVTSTGTLTSTSGAFNSLKAITANITTLTSTTLTTTTETVSGTSNLTNVNVSGNMSGANAYFQNTATQNLAAQGAQFGFNGLLVVGPTTLIGSLQATGGLSAPSANITSLTAPLISSSTGTITNLTSTTATIGTANITTIPSTTITSLTAPSLSSTTGTITNLTSTNANITSATMSSLTVTNLVVGGETGGSLYINTGVVSNLTVMNQIITGNLTLATGATIGSVGDTIFTDASLNVANVFTVNAYNGNVTSTGGILRGATGVFEHLNITVDLSLATGATINGNLNLATGSTISSSSDTLFTDASLNVANVFVVNAYNGDVTSTGTLTSTSGAFNSLKAINGTITTLTSTTAYLTDTISSGNMSGANGYFLNLAGQNLACQSANVGFSGLSVVGTSSLIGALYATGGINTQGITTTTLAVSYSSSTGSAGAVTSNTTRGKIVIPSGSTSATVTNSLVSDNSSIFATISPRIAGQHIEGINISTGSFTVYINSSSGSDININWMVIN